MELFLLVTPVTNQLGAIIVKIRTRTVIVDCDYDDTKLTVCLLGLYWQ
jgi:hypothetical protein